MAYIYERKDSGFFWVSYKKAGKRKNSATPYTKAQRQAAEQYAEELSRLEAREAGGPSSALTVSQWAEDWLKHRRSTIRSYKDDESRIRLHVCGTDKTPPEHPTIGSLPLAEVKQQDIQRLFDSLRARHERKELASGTIRCIWASTCVMFEDAETKGLVEKNPMRLMSGTLPSVAKEPTLAYSLKEIETVLRCRAIPEDRRIVYGLLFFLGARFGEVAALRWRDFTEDTKPLARITISKSWSNSRRETGITKTGVTREQPVHPVFKHILLGWRDVGFHWMFGRAPQPDDLVIPSRANVERSSNHMLKRLREDLKRAGISNIEARKQHAFRKSFISCMRNADVDKSKVRAMTHGTKGSSDVIDSFYTTWDWETLCKAVRTIKLSKDFVSNYDETYYDDATVFVSVRSVREKWRGGRDSNEFLERSESLLSGDFPELLPVEQIVPLLDMRSADTNVTPRATLPRQVVGRATKDATYATVEVICEKCGEKMLLELAPTYECLLCGGQARRRLAIPRARSESSGGTGRSQERV